MQRDGELLQATTDADFEAAAAVATDAAVDIVVVGAAITEITSPPGIWGEA